MQSAKSLKDLRTRLRITARAVEEQSQKIAKAQGIPDFFVSNHGLTKLENTDCVPSIHKLLSLNAAYRVKISISAAGNSLLNCDEIRIPAR
jgi:transcriptional regulator with XRE-family HTH domain